MINNIKTDTFYDGYYWQGSQCMFSKNENTNFL